MIPKRILAVDVGTGKKDSMSHFAILARTDRFHYVRSGSFDPRNIELFAVMLQTEKYDIVAIERGFLYPGRSYGEDILYNIENSAKLHREAERLSALVGFTPIWLSQPEWSRYLCGRKRSATRDEVIASIKVEVQDLPKLNKGAHTWDAIGLAVAAYYADIRLRQFKRLEELGFDVSKS